MAELHLKQPGFTYRACEPFTKHHGRIKKFRERSKLKHLCRSEIDKAYFAHQAAYFDSKDSGKITISSKMFDRQSL